MTNPGTDKTNYAQSSVRSRTSNPEIPGTKFDEKDPEKARRDRDSGETYRCLQGRSPGDSGYRVCSLRECDIQSIRIWRNAQLDVLRQASPISVSEQRRYYTDIVRPTFAARRPPQILLSLLLDEICIGYTGLTNIDWQADRSEISFLLDPQRIDNPELYRRDFGTCLDLLSYTAFELLGLHRLFAETFDIRPLHVELLEAHGYALEGRMRDHIKIGESRIDSLIHGLVSPDRRMQHETGPLSG